MMKKLDYDLLATLVAAAESRNFLEAAERLQISQPAVSLKLQKLQEGFSIPLFQLQGKKKVLTHFGKSLYQIAAGQQRDLDLKLERLQRQYSSTEQLTLRLGGRADVLEVVSPHLQFSGKVHFHICSASEAVQKLLRNEVDIAISHFCPDSSEVHAQRLFLSRTQFAVHESLLSGRKFSSDLVYDPKFLMETPCIFYQENGHLLGEWVQMRSIPTEKLKIRFVVSDWRTVHRFVETGLGYALMPDFLPFASSNVLRFDLSGHQMKGLEYYALYEKSLARIPAFKDVLKFQSFKKPSARASSGKLKIE